jgi:hypothetical protein
MNNRVKLLTYKINKAKARDEKIQKKIEINAKEKDP